MMLSRYAMQRGIDPRNAVLTVRRFDFVIQFAWEETPPSQRKLKEEGADTETGSGTSTGITPKTN